MSHAAPPTRLLLLSADPARASVCLHVESDGRLLARVSCDLVHPLPAVQASRDILAVPSEAMRLDWHALSAHSPAQALAVARLMVQDHIANPGAALHVAIGNADTDDGRCLVGVVDVTRMREWLDRAGALGLAPQAVVPDCLLLDAPTGDALHAWERDGIVRVRGRTLAFAAEPDLARRVIGARPAQWLDADAGEALIAANALAAPALDLLQGAHARRDRTRPRRRRRLQRLAALALLSPLLLVAGQTLYHGITARWLDHRADALVAQYQPGLTAAALPAHYRQRIAADLLAFQASTLFEAMPSVPGTQLDSVEFTPDTGLRAGLLHAGDQELDLLRQQLATSGLDAVPLDSQPVETGLRSLVALEPLR